MKPLLNAIETGLESLGFSAPKDTSVQVMEYLAVLDRWNRAINLTSFPENEWVNRIVLESAALCLAAVQRNPKGDWVDLGSGAGIPGIILAILQPDRRIRLIESRAKRIDFLESVISKIGLKNCAVLAGRIEDRKLNPGGKFHCAFARALAAPDRVVQLAGPRLLDRGILFIPGGGFTDKNPVLSKRYLGAWELIGDRIAAANAQCDPKCLILKKLGESDEY